MRSCLSKRSLMPVAEVARYGKQTSLYIADKRRLGTQLLQHVRQSGVQVSRRRRLLQLMYLGG